MSVSVSPRESSLSNDLCLIWQVSYESRLDGGSVWVGEDVRWEVGGGNQPYCHAVLLPYQYSKNIIFSLSIY